MKIFLDTNVIVDSVIPRKNSAAVEKILNMHGPEEVRFYMSVLSVPTVVYLTRRECTQKDILERLRILESKIDVLSMSGINVCQAMKAGYPDFEDGLQILCAEEKGCDAIITADKKHFQGYTFIPVFTPEEFLEICTKE